ncbi:MAG: V-type ATP synthase subunit I, partial [Spirochaetota bacterium]
MIFTSEMSHVTAVVMKDRAEPVAKRLLDLGAVQFNRLADVDPQISSRLHDASVDERRTALTETRGRIEQLLRMGGIEPPRSVAAAREGEEVTEVDVEDANARIDRLANDVERYRSRQAELQRQINRLNDVRRQLAALAASADLAGLGRIGDERHRFLDVRYGRLPADRLEQADRDVGRLSGIVVPAGDAEREARVVVVAMKRNASEVDDALKAAGFRREELPAAPELGEVNALEEADARIERLESEQSEQSERIAAIIADRRPVLEKQWREIRVVELLLSIRRQSSESGHAAVFSGWVPVRTRERAEEAIRSAAGGACYVEWHTAQEMQSAGGRRLRVPVELRNPRFLKPFQMLVTNYGVPAYGTIDPTPLVAIAYLLMFGLMFGDAGHGLVLVVLGLIGSRLLKTPGLRELSKLLTWCGGASIAMGVLFGAYFGYELLPPLWFDYHGVVAGHPRGGTVDNLLDILTLTVYFGIAVIAAGLVLNWINRVRRREWRELVFSKEGILGGAIYAAGVWVAAGFAQSGFRTLPDLSVAGPVILAAAAA